jgi:hypothetical protein
MSAAAPETDTPVADAEARHLCANCRAQLVGAWCHACGQKAHLHDKLSHLVHEMVESIAHFDGRLWRTLPLLVFNPGRLSREWLEGKRVRYIPPLHVFMFSIFLVFLIPNFTGHHLINVDAKDLATIRVGGPETPASAEVRAKADEELPKPVAEFLDTLRGKSKDAKYYGYKIETLAYKLAFLLAPIVMAVLALVTFRPSRKSTAYKHGVVALYGLAVAALGMSLLMLLPPPADGILQAVLVFSLPVHAIVHLRGAYGCSWPGAIARGVVLGVLTLISFGLFLAAIFFLGLTS